MDAPPWSAPEQKIGAPAQPKSAPEKPASAPEPPKSAAGKAGPSTSPATTSPATTAPATTAPVNHAACSPQALNAKDRGKPPAEPDASLHSLYAETMAGHVEGEDSTEPAVLTLTKKEEVAESSSSPARRSVTPLSPPADTTRAPANGLRERTRRDEHAAAAAAAR